MKKWWSMALVAGLLGASSLQATNGLSPIGYGVKSKGMAGVGVALPLDSFVIAVNPAGIVDLGNRIDVELSYTFQRAKYSGSSTATIPNPIVNSKSTEGLWWPGVGAVARINRCMSLGIAAYNLGASDTKWNPSLLLLGNPPATNFLNTHTQMLLYYTAISPSFAWRFCRNQSFGVAVNVIVGNVIVRGVSLQAANSILPGFVTDNGVDTSVGGTIRIGWLGDFFCDTLRVGFSLSSRGYMSRFSKYAGLFGNYGSFNWPWSGELGFAWFFCPCWVLSLEYRYIDWKSNQGMYFSEFANQQGRGGAIQGIWDGPGFGWNNQSVAKLGLAWTPFRCLTLRAGYNWCSNPIPASELLFAPLLPMTIRNHVTAGATFASCLGEISAYYLHGFALTRRNFGQVRFNDGGANTVHVSNKQNEVGVAWGYCF